MEPVLQLFCNVVELVLQLFCNVVELVLQVFCNEVEQVPGQWFSTNPQTGANIAEFSKIACSKHKNITQLQKHHQL